MITVVSVRGKQPEQMPAGFVYVGRTYAAWYGSPLGNPFPLINESLRSHCLAQYRSWLWGRMQDPDSAQSKALAGIVEAAKAGDVALGCWCHPKPCHADIVKAAVEYLIKEGLPQ